MSLKAWWWHSACRCSCIMSRNRWGSIAQWLQPWPDIYSWDSHFKLTSLLKCLYIICCIVFSSSGGWILFYFLWEDSHRKGSYWKITSTWIWKTLPRQLFWSFLALSTKYFHEKKINIPKLNEICPQTSCEHLYFLVGWRRRMLVPRSIVWIKVLTVLWTCGLL